MQQLADQIRIMCPRPVQIKDNICMFYRLLRSWDAVQFPCALNFF